MKLQEDLQHPNHSNGASYEEHRGEKSCQMEVVLKIYKKEWLDTQKYK